MSTKFAVQVFVWGIILFFNFSFPDLFCQEPKKEKESNILIINSTPEGAEVFIDGESAGFTPLELNDIKKEKLLLKIIHKDLKPVETIITDIKGRRELFFVLDGEYGLLNITSEPAGAKIQIDNQDYGITPLNNVKLPTGIHKLKFEKSDYEVLNRTVSVKKTKINVNYKLVYLYSFLTFDVAAETKNISIDDKPLASSPETELMFPYGEHSIEIDNPAFHKKININYSFEPEKKYKLNARFDSHTLRYLLFSSVIPGLGQFLDNSKIKGTIWCAAALAGAALIFSTDKSYNDKVNEFNSNLAIYNTAKSEIKILAYRELVAQNKQDADDLLKKRNLFIAGVAGIYFLNLIDAIIYHTNDYEISVLPSPENIQTGINLLNVKLKLF